MKLADWLRREGITRRDFAARIGVSPGTITSICDDGWMSRDTALAVLQQTGGEVTPTDSLPSVAQTPAPAPELAGAA